MRLSESEVRQRLLHLRNLEHLHVAARKRIVLVEKENKALKLRIKELEEKNNNLSGKIEALSFQFEQIKTKLFGKKPIAHSILRNKEQKTRDIFSYHRPIPTHITETQSHPVSACSDCQGILKDKRVAVFFEEDIPLPIQKSVIKHEVEVGYCPQCKRQSQGRHIPSKKVVLGNNVRKYICVLSIANRLSHSQIQAHLKDVFALSVSMGEIGNILSHEANNLRPEFEHLKQSVVSQHGTHYDETGWKVQKEEQGKFAWVATGTENNDTVFLLGRSRGKGNIEDIGVARLGITDDYGAYKHTFAEHQLCWAHPQRKLRDLVESDEIPIEKREYCNTTYQQFSKLYQHIRTRVGQAVSLGMQTRFRSLFEELSRSHTLDPTPLERIKKSLRKNTKHYFTFLKYPGIPLDNNKAERALRHLVIKRKISFGSQTQRGAETTSILASVILSLKWNHPQHWFQKYLALKA